MHRRSEEPSVTSVECYWKASKLSKVGRAEKCLSISEMAGTVRPTKRRKPEMVPEFIKIVGKQSGGIFDFFNEQELEN